MIDAKVEYKKKSRINQEHKIWLPHIAGLACAVDIAITTEDVAHTKLLTWLW